jgi:uncharacterized membrane protein YdjX (TVP38/TMEM64 family)
VNTQGVSETESAAILAVLAGSIAAIAIVMSFQAQNQNLKTVGKGAGLFSLFLMLLATILALAFAIFNLSAGFITAVFILYVLSVFCIVVASSLSFW